MLHGVYTAEDANRISVESKAGRVLISIKDYVECTQKADKGYHQQQLSAKQITKKIANKFNKNTSKNSK